MRKFLTACLLLLIAVFLILPTGCGTGNNDKKNIVDDEEDNDNSNTGDQNNGNNNNNDDEDNGEDAGDTDDNTEAGGNALETIAETLLLDQEGIRITATEIAEDMIWGKGIKVLIENNSDINVGVQCNSLVVNNYMISELFSSSVAAGKKANDTIMLSSSSLEAAGINTISEIAVSFHIFDDESFETIYDSEEVMLKTSAYGTVTQTSMDDGKELLNNNGIRIIGKYVDEGSFWGAGVLLYIENDSEEDIIIQCDDMSVNGFMVTPFFSCNVNQGRMALDTIDIMSSDLEDNNITEVKDLEVTFKIISPENYLTIYESEPIPFSVE